MPPSYGARVYGAYGHHIHRDNEEVFTEQFARVMSDMVSRYRRATNPDSRQFCQEVRATAIHFAKQIAAQAGAIASCSPLHVKGHAYSDTAGHEHQQRPCPNKDKVKMTDRPRVEVIKKTSDQHRVKVVETKQGAAGLQAPQDLIHLVPRQDDRDRKDII